MKSSLCSDEIFGYTASDEIKSAVSFSSRSEISSHSDFIHRRWISSAKGGFS